MTLAQLAELPVIALDSRDPLGATLGHVLREQDAGIKPVMTVQTYHVALALAHHGVHALHDSGAAAAGVGCAAHEFLLWVPGKKA